ncbi:helix-turn-helix transcriptional regulator [Actinomadura sp. 3N508]|uniref:helix-turn-helix transcriptional regulator n=1 Tax=Actinomadura sp. 3N508 TaxID=3375153 RepID=UPI0037BB5535
MAGHDQGLLTQRRSSTHAMWRWATPQAQRIVATGDLGKILRFHRAIHGINQATLGEDLGYDKTYISLLELGKRTLDDVNSRRRVADHLHLPPHILGVTDPADTDHRSMLQFGESTVRLAEIARQSGHATEAVAELWPLVARLEARVEDGRAEREVMHLLARARAGLGVALGNVLPEERLSTAAHWTAKSLNIALQFEDPHFSCDVLRMHGNELRKARLRGAAVARLQHALALAPGLDSHAATLPLLARAAGALGDGALFDTVIRQAEALLDQADHTSLFNPYALHEIRLRGLVATDRAATAIRLADDPPAATTTVAPQWHVIQFVTIAGVRLRAGDRTGSRESLEAAIREASAQRLPHQLQRILRTASGHLPDIHADAEQALDRLRQEMAA